MELVYLWVEDYKNIQKQGFNFSPRFECKFHDKYDKSGKLLDNCELEIKPKEHIENFFGKNINITAIVGENGSGKSSILEAFTDSLSENSLNYLDEEQYRKYIVIYKYNKNYFYLQKHFNENINLVDKKGITLQWIQKNPNQRLLEWHSDILTLILENETKPKKIFHEDKKVIVEQIQSDKNQVKKLIVTNLMQNPSFKQDAEKFFNPTKVQIKIRWHYLFNKLEDAEKYDEPILNEIETKVNEAKENFSKNQNQNGIAKIFEICTMKKDKLKRPKAFFRVQTDGYMSNLFKVEKYYSCLSKTMANYPIKDVHKNIIKKLDEFENLVFQIKDINEKIIDFIFDLPNYIFQVELSDEKKSFEDLSFGERQLLAQLHFILHFVTQKKIIQYEGVDYFEDENGNEHEVNVDYEQKIKSMIVLLDEFEIGLHPLWQKKAIYYIIDFLKTIKGVDFNLLFTSHSPFILSDLPKENVIFLENGKQVDPGIETFGANIHTLLSHGFFMKDSLMGEFAKEKIQDVINFLNNKKSTIQTKENAWKIIQIIGEPFLKYKLEEKFHENYSSDEVKNNAKIKRLKQEIKRLKKC